MLPTSTAESLAGTSVLWWTGSTRPPDDTITVLSSHTDGDTVHATFAWDANHGKKAGTMHLQVANSRIRQLVIALDSF
jgi:hypothetical protein